jgi:hypothetical protein
MPIRQQTSKMNFARLGADKASKNLLFALATIRVSCWLTATLVDRFICERAVEFIAALLTTALFNFLICKSTVKHILVGYFNK